MKIGVVFPQTEIGTDTGAVREYAQAAESMGYDHLLAFDHILGANAASRPGWSWPYQHTDMFYEPFTLFAFLAGITSTIEFASGVIILPQRQTALVAKQAATVDVLSGGRLRLGIGVGWNAIEYEALGQTFSNRGHRSEEQVELMRALWTQDLVTYKGRWHTVTDAGLNPRPIQRPIPIWFGGMAEILLRRVARLGDGWFPVCRPDDAGREGVERMRDYARSEGRDPASIGIESWLSIGARPLDELVNDAVAWKDIGATHISVNTMGAGLSTPDGHIDAIRRFKESVASVVG